MVGFPAQDVVHAHVGVAGAERRSLCFAVAVRVRGRKTRRHDGATGLRGRDRGVRAASARRQRRRRRPGRRDPGRARRSGAVPRRAWPGRRRARRAADPGPGVPHRLGDQAVRRGGRAETGRGGQGRARRSGVQVPQGLPQRRRDQRAPVAQSHLRSEELHRHRRLHDRIDQARPEHPGLDRRVQGSAGGFRPGPGLCLQQLRLCAGRRGDRGGQVAPMGYLDMSQPHAAGALVSTLDDLLRWNLALHEGKVLKPANYRAMISPEGKAAASGYGYGIERASVRGRIGRAHGGGIFGFASYLLYLPDSKTTVAILTNSDTGLPGGPSLGGLSRKLAAMALGDAYPAVVAVPVDAEALRQAEGVYRQNPHSAWVLRAVDGGLTVQRIGGQRLPLTAVARDTFAYPDGIARMSLERDARGAVTGMRFFADGIGESEFTARSGEAMP
ncbi:MAG: serine hydrolase [Lysobacter sp.]|nr:serine hydrolase [Lysobacter sp.]